MTVNLQIDDSRCVGAGNCEAVAPGIFQIDDEGVSHVVDEDPDDDELVDRAIVECPAMAIRRG